MAEKAKKNTKELEKKHYVDPTKTWWGKAVVWIIVFGMVGLVALTLIVALLAGNA